MSSAALTHARRIYVASSWRNHVQPEIVGDLRRAGHSVYDFRNPRPGDHGFAWSDIDPGWLAWKPEPFRDALGDLSRFVMGFEMPHTKVGDLARARFDLLLAERMIEADVAEVFATMFRRRRVWRWRWLSPRTHRYARIGRREARLRSFVVIGDSARRWVKVKPGLRPGVLLTFACAVIGGMDIAKGLLKPDGWTLGIGAAVAALALVRTINGFGNLGGRA